MEFISKIPQLMKETGMGPKALERKSGLSWNTAWAIFHGEVPKTITTLGKLCDVFQCQPEDLIERKGTPTQFENFESESE